LKILINYADENFKSQQKLNSKSGQKKGGFDQVIEFSPKDLNGEFLEKHSSFMHSNKRGGGYWLWKPYILLKTLVEYTNDGDYVFYCDSGCFFINSIDYLIDVLEKSKQDILLTEIPLLEYQWTKKECFLALNCLDDRILYSNQIQGGYILVKKTKESVSFIEEYLNVCSQYELLDDSKNIDINNNLIDHRHDQSILSLLSKKRGFVFFRDISQYGQRPFQYLTPDRDFIIKRYENSNYPQIICSYRKNKWWLVYLKERIKDKLGFKIKVHYE
jgi:hypothetical protein